MFISDSQKGSIESIEKLRFEEIAEVLEIQKITNLAFWSAEDYRDLIEKEDYCCLTVKVNHQIKGFLNMRLIRQENSIEIINIAVFPALQCSGLGQKLFLEALNYSRDNNIEVIFLEVRKSNGRAVSFYKKNEFAIVGERKDFYRNPPESALLMRRNLKKLD